MKPRSFILSHVAIFLLLGLFVQAAMANDYKIGQGDHIEISAWKNPDLTRQLVVLPDGTVRFPLIGELQVQDKSIAQLEKEVIEKLQKYIPDPVLSVTVIQPNSMVIYIIGKVNQPGRFQIHKNIDVLQALAVAGGLNPFAQEKEIKIFRKKGPGSETTIFNFNYKEVSQGKKLNQNILLQRGDIIVVR